jgi:hypothetical protein
MRRTPLILALLFALGTMAGACGAPQGSDHSDNGVGAMSQEPASLSMGPLKPHPLNPRYFSDGSGRAVYLTGSHVHPNFQDRGVMDSRFAFDYARYLDFLQAHNHNFIRLWVWENVATMSPAGAISRRGPMPYTRPGPEKALDREPRFDLASFDQAYFDRLRARVVAARERGIYVGIMLFQGWSVWNYTKGRAAWEYHPYNAANNINGIDGDPGNDGDGDEVHSLKVPAITALQKAYIRKVVDTVNDLDNVLYEISNESRPSSRDWQYAMINYLKEYEAAKPARHPIGMTSFYDPNSNRWLFESPAAWISPHGDLWNKPDEPYFRDPPATTGDKVSILDTDHIGGTVYENAGTSARAWVWKSFTRGHNVILMDDPNDRTDPVWRTAIRLAMGHTLHYSRRVNLAAAAPDRCTASTGYCLADPGKEYLIYQPSTHVGFTVQVTEGTYRYEWFNPARGEIARTGTLTLGSGNHLFAAPFSGDAVLYLQRQ